MSEEEKQSPTLYFADLPRTGEELVIKDVKKLASGTGTNSDGDYDWELWRGEIENFVVWEGRGNDKKAIKDYSGEITFFPSPKLITQLKELVNDTEGSTISVKKVFKTNSRGKEYTTYKAKLVEEGSVNKEKLTPTELKLVQDALSIIKSGFEIDEESFIMTSQTSDYEGKISKERAKELFKKIKL